jgi:hypothetical protein
MNSARYVSLQASAEKPYKLSVNVLNPIIFKSGKLISTLSQPMRQVPDKLLFTKY